MSLSKHKLLPLVKKYHKLNEQHKLLQDQLDELKSTLKSNLIEGITTIGPYKITKLLVPSFNVESYKAGGYFKIEVRKL